MHVSKLSFFQQAYMKWRETNGEEAKLPGLDFTNEQLFFIAFGQVKLVDAHI